MNPRARSPTYHSTNAAYTLPNDSIEQARLEDQAAAFAELMHNNVVHAPLTAPAHIIDIGCGTGIQSCELGTAFPSSQVYGVDLSPVPTRTKPPNVEFVQGNVRQLISADPRFCAGSVDYVFARLLVLGMTDWQGYVNDVASLLKSGGWAEMQDYDVVWYRDGKVCSSEWSWLSALRKEAEKKGWDYDCGSNAQRYMERAGLVEIKAGGVPCAVWDLDGESEA
ncbi:MAG: hypothetical protein Q9226_003190 [Calogaya cf. arnoldii]